MKRRFKPVYYKQALIFLPILFQNAEKYATFVNIKIIYYIFLNIKHL